MNITHDTGIAAARNPNLMRVGNFARDVLSLVWANSGITIAAIGIKLDDTKRASQTVFNLRRHAVVTEHPVMVNGKRVVRWAVNDPELVRAMLRSPVRDTQVQRDKPWVRCVPDPDLSQPPAPMPAADPSLIEQRRLAQPPRRSEPKAPAAKPAVQVKTGPAPRARQESPMFSCDATRHLPVVRPGSLDALRLRSLRCPTDRGTPEVRMAVVEAGSQS